MLSIYKHQVVTHLRVSVPFKVNVVPNTVIVSSRLSNFP